MSEPRNKVARALTCTRPPAPTPTQPRKEVGTAKPLETSALDDHPGPSFPASRSQVVAQSAVRAFYEGVCGAISDVDPRMPCIVGPAPYYKVEPRRAPEPRSLALSQRPVGTRPPAIQVWQLNSSLLLRTAGGRPMDNVVYTFDFFDP